LWGLFLGASSGAVARAAVFVTAALDPAGPRIRPLCGGGIPSGGCEPAILPALADLRHVRRIHPDPLAIYSRKALFDIGIAGPLGGFVFLLPALAVGIAFSKVIPGIAQQGQPLFSACRYCNGCWCTRFFPGAQAADIHLYPVARAAWVGMFATAMNLLPVGQLDGGHILYSFFPSRHRSVSKALCILMLPLGFLWKAVVLLGGDPVVAGQAASGGLRYRGTRPRARQLGWLALLSLSSASRINPSRRGAMKITATILGIVDAGCRLPSHHRITAQRTTPSTENPSGSIRMQQRLAHRAMREGKNELQNNARHPVSTGSRFIAVANIPHPGGRATGYRWISAAWAPGKSRAPSSHCNTGTPK